jgi:uncharacterized membrane protein YbhN (UPF0104 family)
VVSAAAVAVLLAVADPGQALDALLAARPGELAAAVAVFAVALVGRAACSRELVDGRGGLGGAFSALTIGYLVNNLLPLRAGEVARAVVLGRRSGLGFMGGATAVAAERLLDLVMAAAILLAGLAAVGVDAGWAPAVAAAAAALIGLATLVALARHRRTLAGWLEARLSGRPRLAAMLPKLVAALDGLARPGRLLRAAAILGASWALAVVVFWLVMRAFIPAAPLSWAAFGLGVMAFGIALPSSPGAIGVYEAAWVGALAVVGVEPAEALAFALAAHAMTFGITTVCGVVCLAREVPSGDGGVLDRARRLLDRRPSPASEEASQ